MGRLVLMTPERLEIESRLWLPTLSEALTESIELGGLGVGALGCPAREALRQALVEAGQPTAARAPGEPQRLEPFIVGDFAMIAFEDEPGGVGIWLVSEKQGVEIKSFLCASLRGQMKMRDFFWFVINRADSGDYLDELNDPDFIPRQMAERQRQRLFEATGEPGRSLRPKGL